MTFTCSSADGHPGWSHLWALCDVAVAMGTQISL